ncbi:MAG: hypothetical protein HQL18_03280 [Candidatus Omnitrophica bacterium]|nr:hypothetical protein [Candidatus Omnitrophota bacterium]
MKRIGIAASRIAKDNLWKYNAFVIGLSFLLSLLVFFLCGLSLLLAFALMSLITKGFMVFEPGAGLSASFTACMIVLAIVVGLLNFVVILTNIKLK